MTDAKKTFRLLQGDLSRQVVDAIVNSANKSLLDGAGVNHTPTAQPAKSSWKA